VEEFKKGLMLCRKSAPAVSIVWVRPMIACPLPVSRLARTRNEQELAQLCWVHVVTRKLRVASEDTSGRMA